MKITGENYTIMYDASAGTVTLEGILRLYGAAGFFSIEDFNKNRDETPSERVSGDPKSLMELFELIADQQPSVIAVNLEQLELLNSSGINVLSKFVIKVREMKTSHITILGSQQFFWQGKILKNLQKLMPGLNLEIKIIA